MLPYNPKERRGYMSHIIKSEQDIAMISQLLEKLRSNGYNEDILEEILNEITPKNNKLPINIVVGNYSCPAMFSEKEQKIQVSSEPLKNYINQIVNFITRKFPKLEKEIFYNHILLVLAHEVEHYYQCLIGNQYIDFDYKIVANGYKNLMTLKLPKEINPIIAKMKINRFFNCYSGGESLLERNANVEAYDLLCKVAKYENNNEMLDILKNLLSYQLSLGYKGFYNGPMEKTYKKKGVISVYNSFDHSEVIPIEDRVRYGLKIDAETKKKVLKKEFKI